MTDDIVIIDGKQFNRSELSTNILSLLDSLAYSESKISELTSELNVADSARIAYSNAFKAELKS
jgi:hypothetical protein